MGTPLPTSPRTFESWEHRQVQAVVKQIIAVPGYGSGGIHGGTLQGHKGRPILQYDHEQLHHMWDRLGCRFAIEYLRSPLAVMEQELNKISSMVKLLMRQLEEQREEITKGMAQVRELKEECSGKDAAGDEAGRQSQLLHAEEESFAPASSTPTFPSGQEE
ncbi:hypothetical protein QOT17_015275 [Balamuthia mandrillaris]